MDKPGMFRQTPGVVRRGLTEKAVVGIERPVWRSLVGNEAFQEVNKPLVREEQERIAEAARPGPRVPVAREPKWKSGIGRLQVEHPDGLVEDHDPEEFLDDPVVGKLAAESLWKRDVQALRAEEDDLRFRLRDPKSKVSGLSGSEREEFGRMAPDDPRRGDFQKRMDAGTARAAEEQRLYEIEAKKRSLATGGIAGWRAEREASRGTQERAGRAAAKELEIDAAEEAVVAEERELDERMKRGVSGAEVGTIEAKRAEIGERKAGLEAARGGVAAERTEVAAAARRKANAMDGVDRSNLRAVSFQMLNDAGRLSPRMQRDVADESSGVVGGGIKAGKNVLGGIWEVLGEVISNPFSRTESATLNQAFGEGEAGKVSDDLRAARDAVGWDAPQGKERGREVIDRFIKHFEANGVTDGREMMTILKDSIRENVWDPTTDDTARVLSGGEVRFNPKFVALPDANAGIAAINASTASPEAKAEAIQKFQASRKIAAGMFDEKTKAYDAGYAKHAAAMANKGITDPEKVFYSWPGLSRGFIEDKWDVVRDTVAEAGRATMQTVRALGMGLASAMGDVDDVDRIGRDMLASSAKSQFVNEIGAARGQNGAISGTAKELGTTVLQMAPMFAGGKLGRMIAGGTEANAARRLLGQATAATSVYGYAGMQGYGSLMQTALTKAEADAKSQGRELTAEEIDSTVERFQGAALGNGLQTLLLSVLLSGGAEKAAMQGLSAQAGQMSGREVLAAFRRSRGSGMDLRTALAAAKPEMKEFAKQAYVAGKVGFKDEAIEEGTNQFIEGVITKLSGADADKTWDQIGQETWKGAWMGGVIGAGLPVATKTFGRAPRAVLADGEGDPAGGGVSDADWHAAERARMDAEADPVDRVNAEILAADPAAAEATVDEIAAAEELVGQMGTGPDTQDLDKQIAAAATPEEAAALEQSRRRVAAGEVAAGVEIQRELAAQDEDAEAVVAEAEAGLADSMTTGEPVAIEQATAAVTVARATRAKPARARGVLKIARGESLETLTDGEIRALGITRDGKPLKPEELAAVGLAKPMIDLGADGSPVVLDEALAELSPAARARVKMGEAEARRRAVERAAAPAAAPAAPAKKKAKATPEDRRATDAGVLPPPPGLSPEEAQAWVDQRTTRNEIGAAAPRFTVTGRAGTVVEVDAADETSARVAGAEALPMGEQVAAVSRVGGDPAAPAPKAAKGSPYSKIEKRLEKLKESLGDNLVLTDDPGKRAEARKGNIYINLPRLVGEAASAGLSDQDAAAWVNKVIDEEMRHLAHQRALVIVWQDSGSATPFKEWLKEYGKRGWKDEFVAKGKAKMVRDLYGADGFDLLKPDEKYMEGVRIISQKLTTGSPTEVVKLWTNLGAQAIETIRAALKALKAMVADLSPALQAEIAAIEAQLSKYEQSTGTVPDRGGKPAEVREAGGDVPGTRPGGDREAAGDREAGAAEGGAVLPSSKGDRVTFTRDGERRSGVVILVATDGDRLVKFDDGSRLLVKEGEIEAFDSPADATPAGSEPAAGDISPEEMPSAEVAPVATRPNLATLTDSINRDIDKWVAMGTGNGSRPMDTNWERGAIKRLVDSSDGLRTIMKQSQNGRMASVKIAIGKATTFEALRAAVAKILAEPKAKPQPPADVLPHPTPAGNPPAADAGVDVEKGERPFGVEDIEKTVVAKPGTEWPKGFSGKIITTPTWRKSDGKWTVRIRTASGPMTVSADDFALEAPTSAKPVTKPLATPKPDLEQLSKDRAKIIAAVADVPAVVNAIRNTPRNAPLTAAEEIRRVMVDLFNAGDLSVASYDYFAKNVEKADWVKTVVRDIEKGMDPVAPVDDRVFTDSYTGPRWTYGMRNRPLSIGTAPKGFIIGSDGPPTGRARHGTIQYPRKLTEKELYDFELEVMEAPAAKKQPETAIQWLFALRSGDFESSNEWAEAVPPAIAKEIVAIAAEERDAIDRQMKPRGTGKMPQDQIDLLNERLAFTNVITALTFEHGEAFAKMDEAKPAPAAPTPAATTLSAGDSQILGALDGLFAAPLTPSYDKDIPQDRFMALMGAANTLVGEGVTTPEALAAKFSTLAEGRLKPFTQKVWFALKSAGAKGAAEPDWAAIYGGIDNTPAEADITNEDEQTQRDGNSGSPSNDGAEGTAPRTGEDPQSGVVDGVRGGIQSEGIRPGQPDVGGRSELPGGSVPGGDDNAPRGERDDGAPAGDRGGRGDAGRAGVRDGARPDVGSPEANFVIEDGFSMPRGEKARIDANIKAIELLRQIEAQGRNATAAEKKTLAKYSGWGSFKNAFNRINQGRWVEINERYNSTSAYYQETIRNSEAYQELKAWRDKWGVLHDQLAGMLSPEEFRAMSKSIRNAHYTALPIIDSMWSMVRAMGFKGGKVLETSAGAGYFVGRQPGDMAAVSQWSAVELDSITARIFSKLYPDARINGNEPDPGRSVDGQGFQKSKIPNNSIDLVIGNFPFAQDGPSESIKEFGKKLNLHNYFFARSIDKLKPGGIIVAITSNSTMDNNIVQRELLAGRVELIKAIRLPNDAFKENAGAEVTTDILILRKKDGSRDAESESWINTESVGEDTVYAKQAGKPLHEFLSALPSEWVPVDEELREPWKEWRARRPKTGDKWKDITNAIERRRYSSSEGIPFRAPMVVNEYFARNPETVIGRHALEGSMYRAGQYAVVSDGVDVQARLNAITESLPPGLFGEADADPDTGPETIEASDQHREGSIVLENSQPYHVIGGQLVPVRWDMEYAEDTLLDNKDVKDALRGNPEISEEVRSKFDGLSGKPLSDWLNGFLDDHLSAGAAQKIRDKIKKETDRRNKVFASWVTVRNAARSLMDAELRGDPAGELYRQALNQTYDAHVKIHGAFSARNRPGTPNSHRFLFDEDDSPLLESLEDEILTGTDEKGRPIYSYEKRPIFTESMISSAVAPTAAQDIKDAVGISMGYKGRISIRYMADLLKVSESEAENQLAKSGLAFKNPKSGLYETSDTYLSGEVRAKLREAMEADALEPGSFTANIDALKAIEPETRPIQSISIIMGGRWIPGSVYQKFGEEMLGMDTPVIRYEQAANIWRIETAGEKKRRNARNRGGSEASRANDPDYLGTDSMSAEEIFEAILNSREIRVTMPGPTRGSTVLDSEATIEAQTKASQMIDKFAEWTKTTKAEVEHEGRDVRVGALVEQEFNDKVAGLVPPTFTGDWVTLPGQSGEIWLKPHRKAVLARLLTMGYGMMAHGVGSGKTYNLIALAMELRRLGKARRPVTIVQNSTIRQFAASHMKAYPHAKILVADESNFSARKRARFLAKIATGDYDSILMTHANISQIGHDEQAIKNYMARAIGELEEILASAESGSQEQADIQAALDKLQEKLEKMLTKAMSRAGSILTWEQLGVDALIVDEAHEFKNAPIITRKQRVKNLPSGEASDRAVMMQIKTSSVQAITGGKNVFFATGTPITNTMAEAYTMLNFIAPTLMESKGIKNFDDFATMFGRTVTEPEATWRGEIELVERFAKFVNGPELVSLIRSVFDVALGNETMGIRVPHMKGGGPEMLIIEPTEASEIFNDWVIDTAAEFDGIQNKRRAFEENPWMQAIPIMIMQAGMAQAIDPRLINPNAPDDPNSKVNQMIGRIVEIYEAGTARKTAQVVFTDLSNPFSTLLLKAFNGDPFAEYGEASPEMAALEQQIMDAPTETDSEKSAKKRLVARYNKLVEGRFSLMDDIKKKLVAKGIPANEILLAESGLDKKKLQASFDKVNSGEIRVIVGSTARLGVGVNIQERLAAAHNLSPPRDFKPAMMEQRIGRIERQGNLHRDWADQAFIDVVEKLSKQKFDAKKLEDRYEQAVEWLEANGSESQKTIARKAEAQFEIIVINYGLKYSMDSSVYSMMKAKQKFIDQVLMGENVTEEFDDPMSAESNSFALMAAESMGDENLKRRVILDGELNKLTALRGAHMREAHNRENTLERAKREVRDNTARDANGIREEGKKIAGLFGRRTRTVKTTEGALAKIDGRKISDEEAKKPAERQIEAVLYEFGDVEVDTGKPEGKITAPLNTFISDAMVDAQGSDGVVTRDIRVNGERFVLAIKAQKYSGAYHYSAHIAWPGKVAGRVVFESYVNVGGESPAQSLLDGLRGITKPDYAERYAANIEAQIKQAEQTIKTVQPLVDNPRPFADEQEWREKSRDLIEVNRLLAQANSDPRKHRYYRSLSKMVGVEATEQILGISGKPGLPEIAADVWNRMHIRFRLERRGVSNTKEAISKRLRDVVASDTAVATRDAGDSPVAGTAPIPVTDEMIADLTRKLTPDGFLFPSTRYRKRDGRLAALRRLSEKLQDAFENGEGLSDGQQESRRKIDEEIAAIEKAKYQDSMRGDSRGLQAAPLRDSETPENIRRLIAEGRRRMGDPANEAEFRSQQEAFADQGKVIGDPLLANPGETEESRNEWDVSTQLYRHEQIKQSEAMWKAEGTRRANAAPDAVAEKLLDDAFGEDGSGMRASDYVAARIVIERRTKDAGNDRQAHADNFVLQYAYRTSRGELARAMRSGVDWFQTPAERHRDHLAGTIYSLPPKVMKQIEATNWTPAQKREAIRRAGLKRIQEIEKVFKGLGITIEEVVGGQVFLSLSQTAVMRDALSRLSPAERAAIKAIQKGATVADVRRKTGLPDAKIQALDKQVRKDVADKLRAKVAAGMKLEDLTDEMKGLRAAALSEADVEAELERILTIGFGLPAEVPTARLPKKRAVTEPDDENDPNAASKRVVKRWIQRLAVSQSDTLAWAEKNETAMNEMERLIRAHIKQPVAGFIDKAVALGATAEQARVLDGEASTERQRAEMIRKWRKDNPKPRKAKPTIISADWNRPEFSDALASYTFDDTNRSQIMHKVVALRDLVSAGGKIDSLTGKKKTDAIAIIDQINKLLAKDGMTVAKVLANIANKDDYRFDISDWVHVQVLARTISAIDADFLDKGSEFYYASILSGLQTMAVNATAIGFGAWEATIGRAVEMAVNSIVRDPASASFGEVKYILKAAGPWLSRAISNFAAAWASETPFFEEDILGRAPEIGKAMEGRSFYKTGSIGGKVGKFIRTPMRILLATDDFVKTAVACTEVGAMAYRLAVASGLKPGTKEFDSFMKKQVNIPGSLAWTKAATKAAERTFTQTLPTQYDQITDKRVPIRGLGDIVGAGAAFLTKFVSMETDNMAAKAGVLAFRLLLFPFQRVPFNIVRQGARRMINPISAIDIAYLFASNSITQDPDGKVTWKWNAGGQNAEVVERLAQQAQGGLLLLLLLATGAGEGDEDDLEKPILITGSRPFRGSNKGDREISYDLGLGPYRISMKLPGGKRIGFNYGRIEPAATVLGTTIDTMRELGFAKDGKQTYGEAASKVAMALTSQLTEKTFLRGFSDAQQIINGESDMTRFSAERLAVLIAPNLIRQVVRETDPVFREKADGFLDALSYAIWPHGQLPGKRDIYGDEQKKEGAALSRVFDFTDAGMTDQNPYSEMLRRWRLKDPRNEEDESTPQSAYTRYNKPGEKKPVEMTPAQAARFKETAGKRTMVRLKAQTFNLTNPSEYDIKRFKSAVEKGRDDARKILFNSPAWQNLK